MKTKWSWVRVRTLLILAGIFTAFAVPVALAARLTWQEFLVRLAMATSVGLVLMAIEPWLRWLVGNKGQEKQVPKRHGKVWALYVLMGGAVLYIETLVVLWFGLPSIIVYASVAAFLTVAMIGRLAGL